MANLLNRFFKQVVGSENTIRDFVAKISSRGDFKRIEDLNVILSSWNNILLTPRRTYINDPEFGSDLYKYVFDPADEETISAIRDEVIQRISLYDDRAVLQDVEITLMTNGKGYNVIIEAEYEGQRGSLSVEFDEFTFANILTEAGQ
jgi:phage baseplate assembly protein W